MSEVREQAKRAVWSGAIACVGTGLFATQSDLAFDAFKMAFGLTVVVPPVILLAGWLLTRRRSNTWWVK